MYLTPPDYRRPLLYTPPGKQVEKSRKGLSALRNQVDLADSNLDPRAGFQTLHLAATGYELLEV